jgi:hypothetical protein
MLHRDFPFCQARFGHEPLRLELVAVLVVCKYSEVL